MKKRGIEEERISEIVRKRDVESSMRDGESNKIS